MHSEHIGWKNSTTARSRGPEAVDVCLKDPGHPVDLFVTAHIRTLVDAWLGKTTIAQAVRGKALTLEGSRPVVRAFPRWFGVSPFVRMERGHPPDLAAASPPSAANG